MDLGVALEVLGNRALRDVCDLDAGAGELLDVGLKAAQVAREQAHAVCREQAGDADEQLGVVALDVEDVAAHALGVGERGRVAEDEVPAVVRVALLRDPTYDVGLDKLVVAAREAVALHVALGPVQVGAGEVDRRGVLGAAVRRVARRRARVGKQVEEALGAQRLLGHLAHAGAHVSVVEEQARVEALGEVDLEREAALVHEVRPGGKCEAVAVAAALLGLALVGVLRAALGAAAHAQGDVAGVHAHDARGDGEHVEQAAVRELVIDVLGRGVLLHDEPSGMGVCAAGLLACLIQVDGDGVVGEVCVIDAVARDVLAPRPLGTQLCDLREAGGELV